MDNTPTQKDIIKRKIEVCHDNEPVVQVNSLMAGDEEYAILERDWAKAKRYCELEEIIGFNATKLKNTPVYEYPKILHKGYMKYYKLFLGLGIGCAGFSLLMIDIIYLLSRFFVNWRNIPFYKGIEATFTIFGVAILIAFMFLSAGILLLIFGHKHSIKKQTAYNKVLYDRDCQRNAEEIAKYRSAMQTAVTEANAIKFEGKYRYKDGHDLVGKIETKMTYACDKKRSELKENGSEKDNVVDFPGTKTKNMIYENHLYVSMPFNQYPDGDIYVCAGHGNIAVVKMPDGSIVPYTSDSYEED